MDVDGVRAISRRARDLADQTADVALRARRVETVDWRSVAAEHFRDALREASRSIDRCAEGLDAAADALARHANAADRRLDELRAAAGVAVGGLIDLGRLIERGFRGR